MVKIKRTVFTVSEKHSFQSDSWWLLRISDQRLRFMQAGLPCVALSCILEINLSCFPLGPHEKGGDFMNSSQNSSGLKVEGGWEWRHGDNKYHSGGIFLLRMCHWCVIQNDFPCGFYFIQRSFYFKKSIITDTFPNLWSMSHFTSWFVLTLKCC